MDKLESLFKCIGIKNLLIENMQNTVINYSDTATQI